AFVLEAGAGSRSARALVVRGLALHAARHEDGLALAAADARSGEPAACRVTVVLSSGAARTTLGALANEGVAVLALDARFTRALVIARADDGRAGVLAVALDAAAEPERPSLSLSWERGLLRPGEPAR